MPPDRVCKLRLQELHEVIMEYRKEHGRLPPPKSSPEGQECSWRVLVAPYITAKWDTPCPFPYQFDKSWDDPHNRKLPLSLLLNATCPYEGDFIGYPFVSYLMLVRPGMEELNSDGAPFELPDDAVLLVESAGCGIEFGEPKDIEIGSLFEGESPFGLDKLNSFHPKAKAVRAVRVDGKVIDIPKDISKEDLRKLLEGTPRAHPSNANRNSHAIPPQSETQAED